MRLVPVPVATDGLCLSRVVLEAGRANSRAKLSMENSERMQYAWRLTRLQQYSLAEVRDAAGISDGQARKMRQTLNRLSDQGPPPVDWYRALRAAGDGENGSRGGTEFLDAVVQDHATRLRKPPPL